jgi:hypothetical protein
MSKGRVQLLLEWSRRGAPNQEEVHQTKKAGWKRMASPVRWVDQNQFWWCVYEGIRTRGCVWLFEIIWAPCYCMPGMPSTDPHRLKKSKRGRSPGSELGKGKKPSWNRTVKRWLSPWIQAVAKLERRWGATKHRSNIVYYYSALFIKKFL